jgi:FKBP-type peptidyl-prolyl cis-trans isomerase
MTNRKLSGLEIEDLVIGTGTEAVKGSTVSVHTICKLRRGDVVRSSYDGGIPDTFRIGSRDVIAGLENGVAGMRVGGKRRLRGSPHLAYRDAGATGIPPNAVLIFEVELLRVDTSGVMR